MKKKNSIPTSSFKALSFNHLLLLLWILPTLVFGICFTAYNMNRYAEALESNLAASRASTLNYLARTSKFSLYAEDIRTLREIADSATSHEIDNVVFLLSDGKTIVASDDKPIDQNLLSKLITASHETPHTINGRRFIVKHLYVDDTAENLEADYNQLGYLVLELDTGYVSNIKSGILNKTISLLIILTVIMTTLSIWLSSRAADYFRRISEGISMINEGKYKPDTSREYPPQIEEVFVNMDKLASEVGEQKDRLQEQVSMATESLSMTLSRMEKQNRQLMEAREEADKANKSKSQFLARMSHELKTPVNVILGFSRLIKNEKDLGVIKENNEYIHASASQMNALISDLLDLSSAESYRIRINESYTNLFELIENISSQHRSMLLENNLSIKINIDNSLKPYIYTDEIRLQQILNNLLSNAIKYTEDGIVTVNVTCIDQEENIQTILFEVADTGIGIEGKDIENIFDSYFQLTEGQKSNQGYGLGLPIVKQLVSALHGDIEVQSEPGVGTRALVRFTFQSTDKLETSFNEDDELVVNKSLLKALKDKTVLIAEDHDYSRLLLIKTLSEFKLKTVEAKTGDEVIEILPSAKPDLLLLDFHMPGKTGVEVIQHIRKNLKEYDSTPILLMTADTTLTAEDDNSLLDDENIIYKPINYNKLVLDIYRRLSGDNELKPDFELTGIVDKNNLLEEIQRLGNSIVKATQEKDIDACREHMHKLNGISGLVKDREILAILNMLKEIDVEQTDESRKQWEALKKLLFNKGAG